jgi:hypothetical protein
MGMTMSYYLSKKVDCDFDEAIKRVTAALAAEVRSQSAPAVRLGS